jgi:Asp-tRNA(Asn)/Glu-tRNA(Gln) amidotransferase A subunit family amidase
MNTERVWEMSAGEVARLVREGAMTCVEVAEGCLARVGDVEASVQAWAFLDPEHVLEQARAADQWRLSGRAIGPLHGVPVGVKDIIDTADMPTENGSVLHAGRTPSRDATVVAMLRAAGAVIMGKTVTTEFATYAPGKTRNPHRADHTPGGSSSGSAAAVAAGMVPLAVGSQTNGSTIRPASFCGVYGFKPSHGLISRHGILPLSRTLDHVGLFARSIDDIALMAEQVVGHDEADPDTRPRARIPFAAVAAEAPPLRPVFAFVKTPPWERATDDTKAAFAELVRHLGAAVEEVELFPSATEAWDWHRTIMEAEMAVNLEREWEKGRDRLSASLRAQLERGRDIRALDYQRAVRRIAPLTAVFTELFEQRYDAILTPAAPGTAPRGLDATGDPAFCTLWTLCGLPSITLPVMHGAGGLPLGVQLVGRRDFDARLLRTARWLVAELGRLEPPGPR